MDNKETKATLSLFNGVILDNSSSKISNELFLKTLETTVKNGYIFDPRIYPSNELIRITNSIVGISGEKANSSFHKSWDVVKNTPIEILVIQQIIHYITTYGFEQLGIYDEEFIYIPDEVLEVPNVEIGKISLQVIKAMTVEEVFDGIISLANSGIALSSETIDNIMSIVVSEQFPNKFVYGVKNRELKAKLFEYYDLVPQESVEFLRFVINKLTGQTLLIKNQKTIEGIKNSGGMLTDGGSLDVLMQKAPKNLSSIFLRYKELFLAMKSVSKNKSFYNRLRKDAKKTHEAVGEDYLNTVTKQLKNNTINFDEFTYHLSMANNFRKIRLAYALSYRLQNADSIVYRIRNGKSWATNFEYSGSKVNLNYALMLTITSIAHSLSEKLDGVKVLMPKGICYALPSSEKQFSGNIPNGSYIRLPEKDLIVGVYWENVGRYRVDLDLSMLSSDGKIGWNAGYRSSNGNILFSGDMTDAHNGASELFYYRNSKGQESKLLSLNFFNYDPDVVVPYKIIVASEEPDNFGEGYMVDPNNITSIVNMKIEERQQNIGLVVNVNGENRFYFLDDSFGNNRTSVFDEKAKQAFDFYMTKLTTSIDLEEVLSFAGAEIVYNELEEDDYIDLVNIDKTTLIELLS